MRPSCCTIAPSGITTAESGPVTFETTYRPCTKLDVTAPPPPSRRRAFPRPLAHRVRRRAGATRRHGGRGGAERLGAPGLGRQAEADHRHAAIGLAHGAL